MITSVEYCSQREIENRQGHERMAIISITDDGPALLPNCGTYIRLTFLDESPDPESEFISLNEFYGYFEGIMTPDQAIMLRGFVAKLAAAPIPFDLVIHCFHGRYRSAAIAQFVNDTYQAPLNKAVTTRNEHVYRLLHNPFYIEDLKGCVHGR